MLEFIAHAGETHKTTNESLLHYLEVWYIAVPIFVVVSYIVATMVYGITKKSFGATLASLLLLYVLAGLFLYEKTPIISLLSIVFGFCIAVVLAYGARITRPKK